MQIRHRGHYEQTRKQLRRRRTIVRINISINTQIRSYNYMQSYVECVYDRISLMIIINAHTGYDIIST